MLGELFEFTKEIIKYPFQALNPESTPVSRLTDSQTLALVIAIIKELKEPEKI